LQFRACFYTDALSVMRHTCNSGSLCGGFPRPIKRGKPAHDNQQHPTRPRW
jgi:hypothetical protein